jgi:Tfp pilus assembly protein FimT
VLRQIINEINLARSEALAKQKRTIYCSQNKGTTSRWEMGRIVQQQEKILHTFQALPLGYDLTFKNSLKKNDSLVFTPLGFTASEFGSFYLKTPYETLRIIVSLSGKTRVDSHPARSRE